jgi:hypothetical protein
MGDGDGGVGMGDGGLGPLPNPQSPIPNPQSPIPIYLFTKVIEKQLKIKNIRFTSLIMFISYIKALQIKN